MKDKRGAELSMNVIIIAIIVIIVLVVVVLFFTGGMASLTGKIKSIFGTQTIETSEAQLRCNTYCSNYESTQRNVYLDNFCGKETFDIDTNADGKVDKPDQTCSDLGTSCSAITCP